MERLIHVFFCIMAIESASIAQIVEGSSSDSSVAKSADQGKISSVSDTIPRPADNDPNLKHPVSFYSWRMSLDLGDQAGGPVRINTRFPSEANEPNPASYYHSLAFAGLTFEKSSVSGAYQFGVLARRDFAHPHIKERSFNLDGKNWNIDDFQISSQAVSLGWVFGQVYREAFWKASVAGIAEQTKVKAVIIPDDVSGNREIDVAMNSLSLRSRLAFRLLGLSSYDLSLGPEIHVPIYAKQSKIDAETTDGRIAMLIDLRHAASIGAVLELGFRH